MTYIPKIQRKDNGDTLNVDEGGKITFNDAQAATIADADDALKADYAKADVDDAGTIDGTEIAAIFNLNNAAYNDLATKYNTLLVAVENLGILASS